MQYICGRGERVAVNTGTAFSRNRLIMLSVLLNGNKEGGGQNTLLTQHGLSESPAQRVGSTHA